MNAKVLLTDFAWPDVDVERDIIERAGLQLVVGPSVALPADQIEALVLEHQPAAIMTCWAKVSERAIGLSSRLKVIARLGVGLDNIAVAAATQRGIWVTNVPDYCVEEVSDHAVAMALAWSRGVSKFDRLVRANNADPASANLKRLSSLTCGIVGFGGTGRATARKFAALGCRILVHTRTPKPVDGIEFLDLDGLLASSDIVVLHVPHTAETHHLIGRRALSCIKRGALLVNVSRGAVVDNEALTDALRTGVLSGAALDVWEGEPAVPRAWLSHPEVILTPHIAFSSDLSIYGLRRQASEDVVRVMAGQHPLRPCNQVAQ